LKAYYNEFEPFAAAWLRELIKAGLIADGEVDERDIREVQPDDLKGFTQHHFFAGIGVWSYALRAAGWPDDAGVWTGSCPCQSFSAAGKRLGFDDSRHLWPAWFSLIQECKPVVVFGEQVASKNGLAWLDVVSADLEGTGYAVGAADLCAAGFGAPHIRQRLWFVADAKCKRTENQELGETEGAAISVQTEMGERRRLWSNAWERCNYVACSDGLQRGFEPGTFPLAHGTPNRVGRLRGYGNALCAPVAEAFIRAYIEAQPNLFEKKAEQLELRDK
jgi:DNA (cytosine-5)-methyltransferase 1